MATSEVVNSISLVAGADLSTKLYHFLDVNSDGNAVQATGNAIGVALTNPLATRAVTVQIGGVAKVIAGGNFNAGARIASNSSGQAIVAASTNHVLGRALESGEANKVVSILLMKDGVAA